MTEVITCPSCLRPNASHRERCMYCGAIMPNPAGKPPARPRPLPSNIDQLIRAAMTGQGSTDAVRHALGGGSAAPVLVRAEEVDPKVLDAPTPPVLEVDRVEISSIGESLGQLAALIAEARSAWYSGRGSHTEHKLAEAQPLLRQLLVEIGYSAAGTTTMSGQEAPSRSVSVPSNLLFIDGPGDSSKAAAIARALDVDAVTARMLSVCRHPTVAFRANDAIHLGAQARRFAEATGLRAAVISQQQTHTARAPIAVMELAGVRNFQVSSAAVWLGAAHDPLRDSRVVRAPQISLVVPGEIVVARYRGQTEPAAYTLVQEDRVGVVDLHGPEVSLRFIEGVTDFAGMPGYDPNSTRRSFRGFLDKLGIWFPTIRKLGPRVCRPAEPPRPVPDRSPQAEVEANGWATWEEHTRLCNILYTAT